MEGEDGKRKGIGLMSVIWRGREREREREMKTWNSKRKWKTRKKTGIYFYLGGG